MEPEAAVHQPRQHAHLGMPEQFARELRRAIARPQPAQVPTLRAGWAVGKLACDLGEEIIGLAVMAAHFEQRGFGALAQGHHVDARRHREQDVPHLYALSRAVSGLVRGMVAAAGVLRRLRHGQFALQQGVDCGGGRFADHTVGGGSVLGIQQTGALRRLAQQFGAGALAQFFGRECFQRRTQCDAVHACDDGGGNGFDRHFPLLSNRRRAGAGCSGPGARRGAGCAPPGTGERGRTPWRNRSRCAPTA